MFVYFFAFILHAYYFTIFIKENKAFLNEFYLQFVKNTL